VYTIENAVYHILPICYGCRCRGRRKLTLELAQNAHTMFVKAPASERKEFLQYFLSNCTLREGKINPEFNEPFAQLHVTNTAWKASGAVSSDLSAVCSVWYPT
jgi:hypothetical protein